MSESDVLGEHIGPVPYGFRDRFKLLDARVELLLSLLSRRGVSGVLAHLIEPGPSPRPSVHGRLNQKFLFPRIAGVASTERLEQIGSLGPAATPQLKVSRRLRSAVERRRHLE
jgi:hypothetical protein